LRDGLRLGYAWDFGDFGVLERGDLPLLLFLYDDQRWAGFYFARFAAFLKLHVASGEYHRDLGAQKTHQAREKDLLSRRAATASPRLRQAQGRACN
jgi:hypothetical protein